MDEYKATSTEIHLSESGETLTAVKANGALSIALTELRQELVGGLLYTHSRANANTTRLLEVASFLYGLIELLQEKGIIMIAELDAAGTRLRHECRSVFWKRVWA